MVSNRDDEYVISLKEVRDRVGKPVDRPEADTKSLLASRARMIDDELPSRIKRSNKPVSIAVSLTLEISSGFDEIGASLVVQFAGHRSPLVVQRQSLPQRGLTWPYPPLPLRRAAGSRPHTRRPTECPRRTRRYRAVLQQAGHVHPGSAPSPYRALLRMFATCRNLTSPPPPPAAVRPGSGRSAARGAHLDCRS